MIRRQIRVLEGEFSVHRLNSTSDIPSSLTTATYCWIARTREELSVICEASVPVEADRSELGWSCLKVLGPLDFSETGIMNSITTPLSEAEISVVALSTFDTDYFLVKTDRLEDALRALEAEGWEIESRK